MRSSLLIASRLRRRTRGLKGKKLHTSPCGTKRLRESLRVGLPLAAPADERLGASVLLFRDVRCPTAAIGRPLALAQDLDRAGLDELLHPRVFHGVVGDLRLHARPQVEDLPAR